MLKYTVSDSHEKLYVYEFKNNKCKELFERNNWIWNPYLDDYRNLDKKFKSKIFRDERIMFAEHIFHPYYFVQNNDNWNIERILITSYHGNQHKTKGGFSVRLIQSINALYWNVPIFVNEEHDFLKFQKHDGNFNDYNWFIGNFYDISFLNNWDLIINNETEKLLDIRKLLKPSHDLGDDELVIQIRSGDIYETDDDLEHTKTVVKEYNPEKGIESDYIAPFHWYEKVVKDFNPKKIWVVCEDDRSPQLKMFEHFKNVEYRIGNSIMEDFCFYLGAKNLVSAGSSKILWNVYNLNPNIKNFYCFLPEPIEERRFDHGKIHLYHRW